jgi:hypothetical protein
MRASVPLPPNSSGFTLVRARASLRGTPPDCADPYALSLKLTNADALPLEGVASRCPAGHESLPFLFSSDRHVCDYCSSPILSGSQGWRCIECNHDVCHNCNMVESYDVEPDSILSSQTVTGVCGDSWRPLSLYAGASAADIMPRASQRRAQANALFAHFHLSGRDTEGWAGHHGTAFSCVSVSYLHEVKRFEVAPCKRA